MVHTLCSVFIRFLSFFFKQKTAYEMRISDWSSDVCSSDLASCAVVVHILRPSTMYFSPSHTARVLIAAVLRPASGSVTPKQAFSSPLISGTSQRQIGRASCRERVCQYV